MFRCSVLESLAKGYMFDGSAEPLYNVGWWAPAGQMYSTANDLNKVYTHFRCLSCSRFTKLLPSRAASKILLFFGLSRTGVYLLICSLANSEKTNATSQYVTKLCTLGIINHRDGESAIQRA